VFRSACQHAAWIIGGGSGLLRDLPLVEMASRLLSTLLAAGMDSPPIPPPPD